MSYFRLTSNLFSYSENPSCWLDFNNVICLLRLCCVFGYVVFLIAKPKAGRLSNRPTHRVSTSQYSPTFQRPTDRLTPILWLTPTQLTKCLQPRCCDCCQRQNQKEPNTMWISFDNNILKQNNVKGCLMVLYFLIIQ